MTFACIGWTGWRVWSSPTLLLEVCKCVGHPKHFEFHIKIRYISNLNENLVTYLMDFTIDVSIINNPFPNTIKKSRLHHWSCVLHTHHRHINASLIYPTRTTPRSRHYHPAITHVHTLSMCGRYPFIVMDEGGTGCLGIDFFRSDLDIYTCHHMYLLDDVYPMMSCGNWVTGMTMALEMCGLSREGGGVKKVLIPFVFFLHTWLTLPKKGFFVSFQVFNF